ncbi:hypothetical protein ACI5K4_26980, partial [Klebsiella pneumoniae]|uniref:hypothetical protein n=1 Tax=Klebsiella pneumoniae TaxID=573 RepID=UPI003865D701
PLPNDTATPEIPTLVFVRSVKSEKETAETPIEKTPQSVSVVTRQKMVGYSLTVVHISEPTRRSGISSAVFWLRKDGG